MEKLEKLRFKKNYSKIFLQIILEFFFLEYDDGNRAKISAFWVLSSSASAHNCQPSIYSNSNQFCQAVFNIGKDFLTPKYFKDCKIN